MGWKRLSMKVRFPVDQSSSLEQPFMSNASMPFAVIREWKVAGSNTAKTIIPAKHGTTQESRLTMFEYHLNIDLVIGSRKSSYVGIFSNFAKAGSNLSQLWPRTV
jgi:hypothetical protein